MSEHLAEPDSKPSQSDISATLTLKLRADSGYYSDETHRISADQWGRISEILNEVSLP